MRKESDKKDRVTRHSGTHASARREDHARHERIRIFEENKDTYDDDLLSSYEEEFSPRKQGGGEERREKSAPRREEKPPKREPERVKKDEPRKTRSGGDPDRFMHQVVPYVLFWVALFAAVSFVLRDLLGMGDSAGSFGNWFADFLCGLLGFTAYLLPFMMVIFSIRWKKLVKNGELLKRILLSIAFLWLLSGIIHVFQDDNRALAETANLYAGGMARTGGGLLGGFLGEWMGKLVRLPGTCLLAMPILAIVTIYLLGLTPTDLAERVSCKLSMISERRKAHKAAMYEGREAHKVRVAPSEAPAPQKETPPAQGASMPPAPVKRESEPTPKPSVAEAPARGASPVENGGQWCEPRPIKRSNEPRRYEFRDFEQSESEALAMRRAQAAKAAQTTSIAQAASTVQAASTAQAVPTAQPAAEPASSGRTTIVTAADTPRAQTAREEEAPAQVASAPANEEGLDAVLTDVLGGMNMIGHHLTSTGAQEKKQPATAQTPSQSAPSPSQEQNGSYYAPFALPVRPEPKREKPDTGSRIVIKPHSLEQDARTGERELPHITMQTEKNQGAANQNVADELYEELLGYAQEQEGAGAFAPQEAPEKQSSEGEVIDFAKGFVFDEDEKTEQQGEDEVLDALLDEYEEIEELDPSEGSGVADFVMTSAENPAPTREATVPQSAPDAPRPSIFFENEQETEAPFEEPLGSSQQPSVAQNAAQAPQSAMAESEAQRPISIVMADKPQVITSLIQEDPNEPAAKMPKPPREYRLPPMKLLNEDKNDKRQDYTDEMLEKAEILRETLASFNVRVKDQVECSRGPAITRYELRPEAGISVRSVINRIDDISLNMAAPVRIEAPIPGKPAIGIEVPNAVRETVFMRTMLESDDFKNSQKPLEIPLGLGIGGDIQMCNLASMPHLLVAGTTGSGKSVCINTILISLMYKVSPADLRLILIDPKQVEFAAYAHVPHLYAPIVTESARAVGALACAVQEMERRYSLIKDVGMRDIDGYNEVTKNDPEREHLPRMVIVIDEFADLKMSCPNNDAENHTCRLAQKARAAGIHLIIGTQRPSVDVITGKLKNNIPSRIAFTVKQQVDSRTILDTNGAEALTGKGDMLYMPVGCQKPIRVQGAFVSDGEVERVITYIRDHNEPVQYNQAFMDQIEAEMARANSNGRKGGEDFDDMADDEGNEDPKFREAVELAIETQKVATSLLQRRLGVGYGRAAKLIDRMEALGYVSAADGNKARKVLITHQEYMAQLMNGEEPDGGDFTDEFN